MKVRYFLDTDDSGHWYLIPEARRMDWVVWLALDEKDEASWEVPDYATNFVTFADPIGAN